MKTSWICIPALLCALSAPAANSAEAAESAGEASLRAAVAQAAWPGDIVRAADAYLGAYPDAAATPAVRAERQRADAARQLVGRNEVRLYRSAFTVADGGDRRLAALGDRDAVLRLARAAQDAGDPRLLGWLQYAVLLGDPQSGYALALHYRRNDEPLLAARYEALALALGYEPAAALDNARK